MDDTAFLTAIREAPKDKPLRLVYADWLDERNDPRGELVRIEEEMQQLPAYSDRFWELKPRRNTLRSEVAKDWSETMRYGTDCHPVFGHEIPDDWKARWRLIREYVERWNEQLLPDVGGRVKEIQDEETRLGRKLSPSIREWVAFAYDVRTRTEYHNVLREMYWMQQIPGHPALSLLVPLEGGYYWGVRYADFDLPDPPIYGFQGHFESYDESTPAHSQKNCVASRLTDFVLDYVMNYCRGFAGFNAEVSQSSSLIPDLEATLPFQNQLGNIRIFEMDNILVRVRPAGWERELNLDVKVARDVPREAIPSIFWTYCHNGGSFYGMFATQLSQDENLPLFPDEEENGEIPF
jgi:uncharacterized protein (TIGR02996 family)